MRAASPQGDRGAPRPHAPTQLPAASNPRRSAGPVFCVELYSNWQNWTTTGQTCRKFDSQPALAASRDVCTYLALTNDEQHQVTAGKVHDYLTSATGTRLRGFGNLQDVDLEDWRTDHGVLLNFGTCPSTSAIAPSGTLGRAGDSGRNGMPRPRRQAGCKRTSRACYDPGFFDSRRIRYHARQ